MTALSARWGLENITWNAGEARRGLLCAIPGAIVAAGWDVGLGIGFALGTLPVALLGVPARRQQRPRLALAGLAFAASYAAGTVLVLGRRWRWSGSWRSRSAESSSGAGESDRRRRHARRGAWTTRHSILQ